MYPRFPYYRPEDEELLAGLDAQGVPKIPRRMWGGFEVPEPAQAPPTPDPYMDRSRDMLDDLGFEGPQRLGGARSLLTIDQGLNQFRPRTRSQILLGVEPQQAPPPTATAEVYKEEANRLKPSQAAALNQASGTQDYPAGIDSALLEALGGAQSRGMLQKERAAERQFRGSQDDRERMNDLIIEQMRGERMGGYGPDAPVSQEWIDIYRDKFGIELPPGTKQRDLQRYGTFSGQAGAADRAETREGRMSTDQVFDAYDRFQKRPDIQKFMQNMSVFATVREQLAGPVNSVAQLGSLTQLPRMMGEVGALSNRDVATYRTRLGYLKKIEDWYNQNINGQLTPGHVSEIRDLVDRAEQAARKEYDSARQEYVGSYQQMAPEIGEKLEAAIPQQSTPASGVVRMRSPDGRTGSVPADQVEAAKAKGFVPVE